HRVTTGRENVVRMEDLQPRTSVRSAGVLIGLTPEVGGLPSRPNHALTCMVTMPQRSPACDHVRENVVRKGNLQPRTSVRSPLSPRSEPRTRDEDAIHEDARDWE